MNDPAPMRALSFWQPIASLVAHGVITLESRSWKTKPGPLAIHAAKSREGLAACELPAFQAALRHAELNPEQLPLGAVVGVAEVDQVIPVESWDPVGPTWDRALVEVPQEGWAFLLSGARALREPVAVRGHHKVWTVPEAEAEAVRSQLPPRPPSIWEEMRRVEAEREEAARAESRSADEPDPFSDEAMQEMDAEIAELMRRQRDES